IIRLWNAKSQREVRTYSGSKDEVTQICFSPDGRFLASGGKDKYVSIWSVNRNNALVFLYSFRGGLDWLALTPDKQYLSTTNALNYLMENQDKSSFKKGIDPGIFALQSNNFNKELPRDSEGPNITWTQRPPAISETDSIAVTFKVYSNSKINDDFTVLLNQKRLPCTLNYQFECQCAFRLKEGKNHFAVSLSNANGMSQPFDAIIEYSPRVQSYALLFVGAQYQDSLIWPAKPQLEASAKNLRLLLEKQYGYSVDLVLNPTRKMLLDKLRDYKQRSFGSNDHLLLLFAGYGINDEGIGYMVLNDTKGNLGDGGMNTYLRYRTFIDDQVAKINCKHQLLLMDVPYAPTSLEGDAIDQPQPPRVKLAPDINIAETLIVKPFGLFISGGYQDSKAVADNALLLPIFTSALEQLARKKIPAVDFKSLTSAIADLGIAPAFRSGLFRRHESAADYLFLPQATKK
ncbi:MAG: caspase family protein, partial [Phycisphaerae bacterium]|nr:caspase family protein [Saprospiraceae bacterium]